MFGEGHAHLFMNGYDYRKAVETHKGHIREDILRGYLEEYRKRGITFIRDGGDDLGVSSFVKNIAAEYGIDYRTPVFAIHKNGHYGSIVGKGFDTVKEYENLVREAKRQGADFIKLMVSGLVDFSKYGVITSTPLSRDEMKELFQGENGLFPTPREISFNCSCPDWALLCKHVAATLYGVGARLDENPLLFFELRGIDVDKFIDVTLANKVEAMLANVDKKSDRMMDDADVTGLFGVM